MGPTDAELLQRYARHGDEDAFAQIVQRHLDLVYSAAVRQVRTPALAEEVSQAAFLELARAAHRFEPGMVVSAWLYQVTRRRVIDALRRETNRQQREEVAAGIFAMNAPSPDWIAIEPWLDDAVSALDEADRTAVLLRFFEGKSLREVGEAIGASENAAQKRVARALENLRDLLGERGVNVGAGGLGFALASHAVGTTPPAVAAAVLSATSTAAYAAVSTSATIPLSAMTLLKKSLFAGAMVLLTGTAIHQYRQATDLREQLAALRATAANSRAMETPASADPGPLREAHDDRERTQAELLRLRGEVARLLREQADAARGAAAVLQPPAAAFGSDDSEYSAIGAATVEAGLERLLTAARRNDPKNFANFVAWRQGEGVPSEDVERLREQMTHNVGATAGHVIGIENMHVLNQRELTSDLVRARVEAVGPDGRTIQREMEFAREGDEWKPVLSVERRPAGTPSPRLYLPLTPELGPIDP